MPAFRCSRCAADHGELPMSFAIGVPDACFDIAESERDSRVILGDETCTVDSRHYFIRGNIELPVREHHDRERAPERHFVWTVWARLDRRDFKRTVALWTRDRRIREPPCAVTLATDLPCYPPTLGLPATLHNQPVGFRPLLRLAPGPHPLAQAQHHGVDRAEIQRIAEYVIHGSPRPDPHGHTA